jgi:3-oxoacyl-[acyl-carrier-protein] synthase-1
MLAVLGLGARTSLGMDLAASAAAARAHLTAFADHPYMVDRAGGPMVVAMDADIPAELGAGQRMAALATSAAIEATGTALGAAGGRRPAVMLFLAMPQADRAGGPPDHSAVVGALSAALSEDADLVEARLFEAGHVAGIAAIQAAARVLSDGFDGACLVVAVDSWIDTEALEWLDEVERLHAPGRPFGFVPGEAAAALLLGSRRPAARRPARAWIAGAVGASEKELPPTEPRLGLALSNAARKVLARLEPTDRTAGAVFVDLNGIPERADEVAYTLLRVSERIRPGFELVAPAEWFGDVGAASVPLAVALGTVAAEKGYANSDTALVLSQSMGGGRGALLLMLPQAGPRP